MELGYDMSRGVQSYPYRVFGTGTQAGFVVQLRSSNRDIEYLCSGAVHGFKVSTRTLPFFLLKLFKNCFSPKTDHISSAERATAIVEKLLRHFTKNFGHLENITEINDNIGQSSSLSSECAAMLF